MISLERLICAIELVQPVLNKADIKPTGRFFKKVASLAQADADCVAFISQAKYAHELPLTQAGVVLVGEQFACDVPTTATAIIVKDAYLAYASISTLFENTSTKTGIHPTAIISPTAKIGKNAQIGAYAVINEGVVIGNEAKISQGVSIGEYTIIGDNSIIYPHVYIAYHTVIGNNVRIHAHASIGSEGFGFAPHPSATGLKWQRIAQLGRVIIGDNVRIGAQTCIDRGAIGDTVIGNHVIIDNLVQIAHNVKIGDGTAMAAMVGIAGSTVIGRNCIIGGNVGISGHLNIADNVTLTGRTFVTSSIEQAGSYSSGTVAMPTMKWRRAAVKFRQMGNK
ncbi:UDP-3-O-(3-hydroxymyristoyl)glucosamine N-acyltransferase [Moraxella nasovis]|uniref:UDP-3-O-(3-hydroxymyristoyl)glucosamine N-acyltransferase n=1 Tax=Moraxella nasovis TaxID=2904121 RepID=UPI001F608008|nr:UDP-3-O-(3-hydroxymyristoyl)glucosamine N-acyltransferase [Moraxella nasovis]UNU73579.1 UDP-3-O-(3-hydroxymyristoyl)glucosamine N-acyltransferase [Moraxella nasovis]